MSEIEKMYENAGVEPDINYVCDKEPCEQHSVDCQECSHLYDTREDYPPFTAEKQLEICKFLLKVEHSISYYFYENRYGFVIDDKQDDCIEAEKFETALAMIVNNLWQDLTDAEKVQIKEILE